MKASCVGGKMTIRVDTADPFEGIIHGPNRTEPGCAVEGRGGRKTYLRIDLGDGSCGVRTDASRGETRVAIAVRAHPTIELLEDKLYVVTCGRAGFQNSRDEISVVDLKVAPPGQEEFKAPVVVEGLEYNIRAEVMDHDPAFGFLVRRCFAFDDSDTSLQLVDDRGCATEKLMSPFTYDFDAGHADATIYSMFRLPHSNRTYFQCDIVICRGECPQPECDGVEFKTSDLSRDDLVDPFAPAEDDAVTTSTSVFVAQPGSEAAATVHYCASGWGGTGLNDEWLLWLCIAFGVLFAIMLLINIFLCSAMTCSCTRSEIIEKEPSVYDDYSIYDSQYGYANGGQAYGSESDYGSEYGLDGQGQGQGHQRTQGSEYSGHHQSTLSRSARH